MTTRDIRTVEKTIYFYYVSAMHKYRDADGNSIVVSSNVIDALNKVVELDFSDDDEKTAVFKYNSSFIAMKIDETGSNFYAGQIASVRASEFPKGLREGKLVNLNFTGIRLYEPAHFVYFTDSNILVMEYNHHAPRHAGFAAYVEKLSKKFGFPSNVVNVSYDIGRDTVTRFLESSGKVTSVKLKVPVHGYETKPVGGLMSMLQGALSNADKDRMIDISLEIKFGVSEVAAAERTEAEINSQNRQEVIDLFRGSGFDFQQFAVQMSGSPNFDFVSDKIKSDVTVELTDLKHVDTKSIYQEMKAVYTARYTDSE
ncbi:hypothetical protein ACFFLM_04645 [Deinococcus oregonensis]|uniref:Uncharacterized protein n=1 Tax=Deinococcus oregonensis TaxID=1805970 RepID=A0ABV6AYM5_9DEIO